MLLSPRAWLAQWPRRLQFFAVALLLLATIAQSWHVCAMSGHVAGAQHGEHGSHGAKKFKILTNADGTPGPVICACADGDAHEENPDVAAVSQSPTAHSHVTCLALLLQTMPLQVGTVWTLAIVETPRTLYATRAQITPAWALPLARRGRAPPLDC